MQQERADSNTKHTDSSSTAAVAGWDIEPSAAINETGYCDSAVHGFVVKEEVKWGLDSNPPPPQVKSEKPQDPLWLGKEGFIGRYIQWSRD
jgi:hypothetical protein